MDKTRPTFGVHGQFGNQSKISPRETRDQIEAVLERYGADGFQYAVDRRAHRAAIAFRVDRRVVRLTVQLPDPDGPEFTTKSGGKRVQAKQSYDRIVRQRWRALLLIVRAKLEAILCGVTTFDDEFLANIVMAGGRTLGEHVAPQLDAACSGEEEVLRLPMGQPRVPGAGHEGTREVEGLEG
jgi:hypothetical protein